MIPNSKRESISAIVLLAVLCSAADAFSGATHKSITEKAAYGSAAQGHLKTCLGIRRGMDAILLLDQSILPVGERIPADQFEERISGELPGNPCSILDFLEAGAHLEDVPIPRARHHFHDPRRNAEYRRKLGE